MSLRAKLLSIILGLLALTTLILDLALYSSLNSFLYQRLDEQLVSSMSSASHVLVNGDLNGGLVPQSALGQWPVGTYIEFIDRSGVGLTLPIKAANNTIGPPPNLIRSAGKSVSYTFQVGQVTTVKAVGESQDLSYRVLAIDESLPIGSGLVVVALPETQVDATLHRLLVVELLVSVGVLLLLSSIGSASLRFGLRPIQAMTDTASAIADGQLDRRVEAKGTGTEVLRLANALNKMLERIQSALDRSKNSEERLRVFIADVSHELRTPLTSIQGYAELYKAGALQNEADLKRSIERIESEAKRMSALVEDLLLLARMDQNRPLILEPIDLSHLVELAVTDASVVQPERKFDVNLAQNLWVLGDKNQITQVVANLMSNVRSHTPPDSPVWVSTHRISKLEPIPPGAKSTSKDIGDLFGSVDPTIKELLWESYARLEVRDSGPGIEPENLSKVFERFYRSDASRSRAQGGAGLGLSLVAAIVHAHGGRAWVYSAGLGKGTTFGVDLPLIEPDSVE
ncbi:two-component system, OmpR family, sensor kinase [Ferrithrix thermotolerans DSM 19514]|jgi:two-component system OmpR family sensor kinase|uniref:histidine kinase n=2 Tax=Ferrithrix TaxID=643949 RepID=A0A1M4VUA7_9ACTN|nr:two-component system, OmpR family, sensor kinase [Ferrithrix thermotolerans DSM 19514]